MAIQDCKGSKTVLKAWTTRCCTLDSNINANHFDKHHEPICGYTQNIEIPFLGDQQPGEAYHLSPKNDCVFGMVDKVHHSNDVIECIGEQLYPNIYLKKEGNKGSNNVASLIM